MTRLAYRVFCPNETTCKYQGFSWIEEVEQSTTSSIICPECRTAARKVGLITSSDGVALQGHSTTGVMVKHMADQVPSQDVGFATAALTTSDTVIRVAAISNITVGDIWSILQSDDPGLGEYVRVTVVGAATTVTVVRGFGGTTALNRSTTNAITKIASGETVARMKASFNLTTSATTLTLDAGYSVFDVTLQDLIRVGNEVMRVSAVSTSNLTVARGKCGTKYTAHSSTVTIAILARHSGEPVVPCPFA